jgi:hypothetical protein
MDTRTLDLIKEEFNTIDFHDALFGGLSLERAGAEEQVRIPIKMCHCDMARMDDRGYYKNEFTPSLLTFRHCFIIRMEVDLVFRRQASDSVDGAECFSLSEWKWTLVEMAIGKAPYTSLEGYLHFRIELCAPAGVIDIVAKDFVLEPVKV